ncbi:MAG: hypothetical protein HY831_03170 [Candidatus Aenigmarchaeota archaeon]|nr:hypothetical protein [Candidatus Aenigmarchaeota archaeon]
MGWQGNEFIIALLVGLMLIAVGVVIFNSQIGFSPYGSSYTMNQYRDYQIGYDIISSDSGRSILIGNMQYVNVKTTDLGTFDISTTSDRIIVNKVLFNGVLFGDNSIVINGYIRDIQLNIKNTNGYGNLIVTTSAEGKKTVVVDKKLGIGKYQIPIETDGVLEIKDSSSAWRIWAPTIYDVTVDTNVLYAKTFRKNFTLEANVSRADLHLFFTNAQGKIRVRVNDRIVLEREVAQEELISFDRSELFDNNNVVIDAWDGSSFTGRAIVEKHILNEAVGRVELGFYLNETDYNWVVRKPGKITFDIVRIDKPGQFVLKIRNSNGNVVLTRTLDTSQQSYEEYYTASHVKPGNNTVIIEAVDGSLFWIRDLKVWVLDP